MIRNDADHAAALAEFRTLASLDPAPETPESDRLDLLIVLIDEYESRRWPLDLPDPVAAIEFYMDQHAFPRCSLVVPLFPYRRSVHCTKGWAFLQKS